MFFVSHFNIYTNNLNTHGDTFMVGKLSGKPNKIRVNFSLSYETIELVRDLAARHANENMSAYIDWLIRREWALSEGLEPPAPLSLVKD